MASLMITMHPLTLTLYHGEERENIGRRWW